MSSLYCTICEKRCLLSETNSSGCGLYRVQGDTITERFANHYLVACPISIETMPMLHYFPRAKFLQISTTGCNFNCPGCISTVIVREMSPHSAALKPMNARQVVDRAIEHQCAGIVFLMNDPLASLPSFIKVARLAHEAHLKVGCSSNTYFTKESLNELLPHLDFINVGFKGFSDKAYLACGAPSIAPVLRNLKVLHNAGVHVEVSCILTRDNQKEINELARFVANLSRRIPFQVMRFLPFETAGIAQEPTIREAETFCRSLEQWLDFVYLFNTPGTDFLHTHCPQCGQIVYHRDFYGPMGAKVCITKQGAAPNHRCPQCGQDLAMIGAPAETAYQEGDFEGGYPLTRALEMVEAMLIAMGAASKTVVTRAWEDVLQADGLKKLHHCILHPQAYIEAVRYFGKIAGVPERSEALARYLELRLGRIESAIAPVTRRPRVYYAMGKPLFFINGGRLENELVEIAGGISVNREILDGGRPGRTLTVTELNRLNPEVIFISSFLSSSVDDFYEECVQHGIQVKAVQERRIFAHLSPGWDFGSPRWILGLMFIAATLHPDRCAFNILAEADVFYRDFYEAAFDPLEANRSFSKPNRNWRWQQEISKKYHDNGGTGFA